MILQSSGIMDLSDFSSSQMKLFHNYELGSFTSADGNVSLSIQTGLGWNPHDIVANEPDYNILISKSEL